MLSIALIALLGCSVLAAEVSDPAKSSVGATFRTLDELVQEFGIPDSKMGALVPVPTDEILPNGNDHEDVHFSASEKQSVSVPYKDSTIAVVVAEGENHRVGYGLGIFLVSTAPNPNPEIKCRVTDALSRNVWGGYSYVDTIEFVRMPQFSKPLLHLSFYNGGRRSGSNTDEWYRLDRGKLEPILSLKTGQYRNSPSSDSGIGVSQETKFRVKNGKLIATSDRTTEFFDTSKRTKQETFQTTFTWSTKLNKFTAKNTEKLEARERGADLE